MSGPTPKPKAGEAAGRKTTPETTREAHLKDREVFGSDVEGVSPSRSGGELNRDIATKDELDRAFERPAGKTRVHKGEEKGADHRGEREKQTRKSG